MTIITEQKWYEIENNDDPSNSDSINDGCRISNDPESKKTSQTNTTNSRFLRSRSSSSSSTITIRHLSTCNITQYMCSTSASTTGALTTTTTLSNYTNANKTSSTTSTITTTNDIMIEAMEVIYEYELYYNQYIDIQKTIIPYIEESIIVNLASQMGLQQQCRKQNRRRQQQQHRVIELESSLNNQTSTTVGRPQFIGIQTKPYDRINPKYTTCQYPIQDDSPNTSSSSDTTIVCVPMLGGVTVFVQRTTSVALSSLSSSSTSTVNESSSYFSDTEQEEIHTIVASYLKDAMDHDVFVVPTSITKLVYVGNSSTIPSIIDSSDINNIPSGSNNSSSSDMLGQNMKIGWLIVLIGFLLCLAILVCCCCFLFCCCRRKRRKQRRQTSDPRLNNIDANNRLTVRSIIDVTPRDNNLNTDRGLATVEGKQGLASFDSLALKDGNDIEAILFDPTVRDSELPTDSDSSGFDDDAISNHNIPTKMAIIDISNEDMVVVKKDDLYDENKEILPTEECKDCANNNDDTSEELVGQKVVELMQEREKAIDEPDAGNATDGESLVETLSDEMDLLDRLAMQGRPPTYPTSSSQQSKSTDLLMIAPTRSLSPTTISAASLGTSTYSGARNIVGSPTSCSQVTMPAGNLRYNSNRVTTTAATTSRRTPGGLMKKVMMVPQHQKQRFVSTMNNTSGSIRTAYTPDSFDEEILGITSADSHDNNTNSNHSLTTTSTASVSVAKKHLTIHDEKQRYQHRHHSPLHTAVITYPDVLDEHLSNTFNENDEEIDDDLFSFQSDHNNNDTTKTTTAATSNAVQRHLQMS